MNRQNHSKEPKTKEIDQPNLQSRVNRQNPEQVFRMRSHKNNLILNVDISNQCKVKGNTYMVSK